MSHVARIDMEIKDLTALKAAAKLLGMEFLEGQTTYRWYGRHVGDYSLPEGFKASDLGKCEHAIGIPNDKKAYEIGVVKRRDGKEGYTLLWDFWAGGYGLEAKVGKDGNKLKEIAKVIGEPIYILKESACRFETENDPIDVLISKAVWSTNE